MRWWWQPCSQWAFVSILKTLLQIAWDFHWQSDHLWRETCLHTPSRICSSVHLKGKDGWQKRMSFQGWWWCCITGRTHLSGVDAAGHQQWPSGSRDVTWTHFRCAGWGRNINSVVSTNSHGQLLATDPLWTSSCPEGPHVGLEPV